MTKLIPRAVFQVFFFTLVSLIATLLFSPWRAAAAPCCGSNGALPGFISGNDRFQISAFLGAGRVIGDVSPDGVSVFRSDRRVESQQSLDLDLAYRFADRWQISAGPVLIRKSYVASDSFSEQNVGFGDLDFAIHYEAHPVWEQTWAPQIFVYQGWSFPLAPSIYDSDELFQTDARGSGFFRPSVGALFLKRWSRWDAIFHSALLVKLPRGIQNTDRRIGFWGTQASLGIGYSPGGGSLRIGTMVTPQWERQMSKQGFDRWVWDTLLQLNWMVNSENTLHLNYVDQTFFGPARNTTLTRSLAIGFSHRVPL